MTGLETHMRENGWVLTHGKTDEWNTYNNCRRSWIHTSGKKITIGLWAKPTRVGLIYPNLIETTEQGRKPVESLPSSNYKEWLDKYVFRS